MSDETGEGRVAAVLELDLSDEAGRLLVASDIHGAFDLFDDALAGIGYDPAVDVVVIIGDLVDRGRHSRRCLEWIGPRRHALQGNHERFLQLVDDGRMGREDHVEDGGSWYHDMQPIERHRYRSVLVNLPFAARIRTPRGRLVGMVHADIAGNDFSNFCSYLRMGDPRAESVATLGRNRIRAVMAGEDVPPISDLDHLFMGHTPQPHPVTHANCSWIDTGLPHGRATVIDADAWIDGHPVAARS